MSVSGSDSVSVSDLTLFHDLYKESLVKEKIHNKTFLVDKHKSV